MNKPELSISSQSGNVFAIIGAVAKALSRAGQKDKADDFKRKAMNAESYDAVLQLTFEYVDWV